MGNISNDLRRTAAFSMCAQLDHTSSPYAVREALTNLIYSSIPGATIRESNGFMFDKNHTLSINMPDYSSNWVVIISEDMIRERGHNCIKVYHLNSGINFDQVYSSPYKDMEFHEAYQKICGESHKLLLGYHIFLSPEALVIEMLCKMPRN